MYVCKDSAAPAHARTRAHRPAVYMHNNIDSVRMRVPHERFTTAVRQLRTDRFLPGKCKRKHLDPKSDDSAYTPPPGVCDTPELWCGAAGLCARVRACAGAAESLHAYIHTPPPLRSKKNPNKH